jgi:hypothetical protein
MRAPVVTSLRRWAAPAFLAGIALFSAACSEKLLTPVNCPELCPGGQIIVYDTVLTPIPGSDTSFAGYVTAQQASAFLVSNNLPAADARGFVRFISRSDTVFVQDTARSYTIDSVWISVSIESRDSMQTGVALLLYKLPPTVDSTATFAELTAAFTPASLLDTVEVPDTLHTGRVVASLSGDALARVALTPADSGVLRVGVALTAPAATGVRIQTIRSGTGAPTFQTFVHADVADTALQQVTITRVPSYNTYQTAVPFPVPTPTTLVVGGAPSARALIRFGWPPVLRDTAEIIRATLEMTPVSPVQGLSNVSSSILAQGVLVDLGAKSPLTTDVTGTHAFSVPTDAPMALEVLPTVKLWQGVAGRPPVMFVSLSPEASSFSAPVFGSSATPATQPRLRISYVRPYQFALP